GDKIIELLCFCNEHRFPDRTFVEFSVANDHKHAIFSATHLYIECNADRNRKQMPQRAGMEFDSIHISIGVPLDRIIRIQMICKALEPDKSEFGENAVERRHVMPFG